MVNKLPKLPKKKSRASCVRLADKWCSLYIRARDGMCVICGSTQNLQNGHLFSRVSYITRWCEVNCHCQCRDCNNLHEYNPHLFTNWFIHKFGVKKYDWLLAKHNGIKKFKDFELLDIADYYKTKLEKL